jgi:hypothetical protein
MTHWMVKVKMFYDKLKPLGKVAKDNYQQDKRNFIESLTALTLNLVFVIAMLEWIIFPIPTIPKQTGFVSPFDLFFVVMKPFWLHILGLLGCILLLNPRAGLWRIEIHLLFSMIVKIRNYVKFVRNQKGKITP